MSDLQPPPIAAGQGAPDSGALRLIRILLPIVVLAAGAWSAQIDGLPRPLPVTPLKGQMLAVESDVLRHAVMGEHVYLVPRRGERAPQPLADSDLICCVT